jgi:hypothetical protein
VALLKRLALLAAPLLLGAGPLQEPASLEYRVKAAYLVNFTRYVEWPRQSFDSPGAPLVICVAGQDPFGASLDSAVAGKSSQGHPLRVRRINTQTIARGCHVVFVARAEWSRDPRVLERLSQPAVLTVGETDQFVQEGGVIGFVINNETVRFAVNLAARESSRLTISSRMLSLAVRFYGGEGAE